jgi:predicted amidohydrolase YtcJ
MAVGSGTGTAAITIFRAARIVTLAGPDARVGPEVGAMATAGEHVVDVGDLADLRDRFPTAEVVDLGGALVVPGLNDAHCHPSVTAAGRLHVDVSPAAVDGTADVARVLAERARATPPGTWVVGAGYVPPRTGPRIDRAALDAVSPEHPVAVVLTHLHTAIANTPALARAGFGEDTHDPVGGRLGRDAAGRLDGWLYELAFLDPYFARPPWTGEPDTEAALGALAAENRRLHSLGLTSYCDAIVSPSSWRLYQLARARDQLTPRVGTLLWAPYAGLAGELGVTAGVGDQRLRHVGIKMMYDGALSGGTCFCTLPYPALDGDEHGMRLADPDAFPELVRAVHTAGGRVCVHANGDAAITAVLDAIEAAQAEIPSPTSVRHRIEHCSMTDAATIRRLAAARVVAVPFGQFIHHHGDRLIELYGRERAARLLAHRSLLDAGVTVAGSSDHPAGPLDPLLALQSLTTRTTAAGQVLGADERIDARQALAIYTVGSAHATGEAALKGRLVPGLLADFTVLDRDILTVDPATIADTAVLSTWVGARCVWSAPRAALPVGRS